MIKDTTGQYLSVDIHALQKHGLLVPGGSWMVSGLDSDFSYRIQCQGDPHRISIQYTSPRQWQATFELLKTRCHYGGFRYWFKCPMCHQRKGKLYRHSGDFKCRTCADLTYYSVQSRNNADKQFGFLAHTWKEDRRLENECQRIHKQKRKQYTYRGETIKRLRFRERKRPLEASFIRWMNNNC